MDEFNVDKWDPDKSWIAFKRKIYILIILGIIICLINCQIIIMEICDCLRKNINGGTCDCSLSYDDLFGSNVDSGSDQNNDDDEVDESQGIHKKKGRITTDWDDFLQ